eukprot:6189519-Pleurochrysis_carterae.AAC.2
MLRAALAHLVSSRSWEAVADKASARAWPLAICRVAAVDIGQASPSAAAWHTRSTQVAVSARQWIVPVVTQSSLGSKFRKSSKLRGRLSCSKA